jgi:hypothetical protein
VQERGEAVALRQQHRVAAACQEAHLQPILHSKVEAGCKQC